jgi:hypothetical protein
MKRDKNLTEERRFKSFSQHARRGGKIEIMSCIQSLVEFTKHRRVPLQRDMFHAVELSSVTR